MEKLESLIKLDKRDIESYSLACIRALEVVARVDPKRMVCLLRGGYPPSKVVHGLSEQYLGKTMDSYAIPTSDFLRNKNDLVYALTDGSIDLVRDNQNHGKILTIDTAISGSSSRQFMTDFANNFKKLVYDKKDLSGEAILDYSFIRFWHDSEHRFSRTKSKPFIIEHRQKSDRGRGKNIVLRFNVYDFGVRNLMAEDKPLLLGLDYPIEFAREENKGVHGQKSEYLVKVIKTEPIAIRDDTAQTFYQPHGTQTTSDLFIDILSQNAKLQIDSLKTLAQHKPIQGLRGTIDMNPDNPYRLNLNTLKYPPYLVDFCGNLVKISPANCK